MMKRFLIRLILPVIFLIFWEITAYRIDNQALLPTVQAVIVRLFNPFADLLGTGNYLYHIYVSGSRVIVGFLIAAFLGVPLGLLAGRIRVVNDVISPAIEFLRPICPIAWIPFAMVMFKAYTISDVFGFYYSRSIFSEIQLGMLFVILYGGFFPIFVNTVHGVSSVKNIYVESANLLGCYERKLFRKIILPAAMPHIAAGLRIGLGTAWMVIVAAEMLPGSESGVGYLIVYAYELADMDVLITGMILTGIVGAALSYSIKFATRRTELWQAKER